MEVQQPLLGVIDSDSEDDVPGLSPNLFRSGVGYLLNDDALTPVDETASASSNEPTVSGSMGDSASSSQHNVSTVNLGDAHARPVRENAIDSGGNGARPREEGTTNSVLPNQPDADIWNRPANNSTTCHRIGLMPTDRVGTRSPGADTFRHHQTPTPQQHGSAEGHAIDSAAYNICPRTTSRHPHGTMPVNAPNTHGQHQTTASNSAAPVTMTVYSLSFDDQHQTTTTNSAVPSTMTANSPISRDQHQTTASNLAVSPAMTANSAISRDPHQAAAASSSTSRHRQPTLGSFMVSRSTIYREPNAGNSITSYYQEPTMALNLATASNNQPTRTPNTSTSLHHQPTVTTNLSLRREHTLMQAPMGAHHQLAAAVHQEVTMEHGATHRVSASGAAPTTSHISRAPTSGTAPSLSIHAPRSGAFLEPSAASSWGTGAAIETEHGMRDRDPPTSSFQGSAVSTAPNVTSSSSTPNAHGGSTLAATGSSNPITSSALTSQHHAVSPSRSRSRPRRRSRPHSHSRSHRHSHSHSRSHSHSHSHSHSPSRSHSHSRPHSHSRARSRSRSRLGIGARGAGECLTRRYHREGRDSTTSTPQAPPITRPSSSSIVGHNPFLYMNHAQEFTAPHLATASSNTFQEPVHPSTSSSNHAPRSHSTSRARTTSLGAIPPLEGIIDLSTQSILPSEDLYTPASSSTGFPALATALPQQQSRSLVDELISSARSRRSSSDLSVISITTETLPEETRRRPSIISLEDNSPVGNATARAELPLVMPREAFLLPPDESLAVRSNSGVFPARQARHVNVVDLLDADEPDLEPPSSDLASVRDSESVRAAASSRRYIRRLSRPATLSQGELRSPPSGSRFVARRRFPPSTGHSASPSGPASLPWRVRSFNDGMPYPRLHLQRFSPRSPAEVAQRHVFSKAPPPRRPRRNNDAASSDAPTPHGIPSFSRHSLYPFFDPATTAAMDRAAPSMIEAMMHSFMVPRATSRRNHARRPPPSFDSDSDTDSDDGVGSFNGAFGGSFNGSHSDSDGDHYGLPYAFTDTDSEDTYTEDVRSPRRQRRRPARSPEEQRLMRRAEQRQLAQASSNSLSEEFAHIQGGPPIDVDDIEIVSDGNNEVGIINGNGNALHEKESVEDVAREKWLCGLRDVKYKKMEELLGYDDLQIALPVLLNQFMQVNVARVKATLEQTKSYASAYLVLEEIVRSKRPGEVLAKKRTKTRAYDISKASPKLKMQLAKPDFERKIQELMDKYASDRRKSIEEGTNATCGCCFDEELTQAEILKCSHGHSFCYACVRKGAESFFGEGLYASEPGQGNWSMCVVRCMQIGGCEGTFSEATLQEALPPASYLRYSQRALALSAALAKVEDLVFCPWCDFVVSMPNQNDCVVECRNPICGKKSCRWCKQKSHIPLRCDEVEKDWEVEIRTRIEEAINDVLGRRCPTCLKKFEKTHGCNHMTCVCGTSFCYLCGALIRRNGTDMQTGKYHYGRRPLCDQFGKLSREQLREMKQQAKVAAVAAREKYLREHPEHKDKKLKHCPIEALGKE
eukprot:GEMP01000984.1.p1 GENE.GEMP01000984.1~~GEMP01000984.1.p1  ORF type:complete len:1538 (+),score=296.78 GEMP01000984.1:117-4730(+)